MYLTQNDIELRVDYGQLVHLTNDDPDATSIDTEKIDTIIHYTNSLIDDSLRGRYELPLSISSPSLNEIAISIAIYKLYELRNRTKMPESLVQSYENALSMLKEYRDGKKLLEYDGEVRPRYHIVNNREQIFKREILDYL